MGRDAAQLDLLRNGETLCVVPVLYEDRATVKAIHALKVEKYAVARAAAAIGLYPREARDTAVSLRLDPCPAVTPARRATARGRPRPRRRPVAGFEPTDHAFAKNKPKPKRRALLPALASREPVFLRRELASARTLG
jgi:hypothetical protein